jgi:hypothetical protein
VDWLALEIPPKLIFQMNTFERGKVKGMVGVFKDNEKLE